MQYPNYHILGGALDLPLWHYHSMENDDKNGGPNHLKSWRDFRGLTQAELARAANTTQHMIAYLESGERGLSAKWLRRLAPALKTNPGMLLDHNPYDLDNDIIEIWATASERERKQLTDIAKTLLMDGTHG